MIHDQLTKNLKPGERVVAVIRRDVRAQLGSLFMAAAFVLGDFFLIAYLLKHRPWGSLAFVVLLIIGIILTIRLIVEWRMNAFILTTERLMHVSQQGLFSRTVSEAMHENITDVRFATKGLVQTLMALGTVEVQTAGEGENLKLTGIRKPQEVQAMITTTLRTSKRRSTPLSVNELVDVLGRMKRELGDDAFRDAVSSVERDDDGSRRS